MPINAQALTGSYEATQLDKSNARSFTVQVFNQVAVYQINAAPFGGGENWVPHEGRDLAPGYWVFDSEDWADFGVPTVQGIRFKAKVFPPPAGTVVATVTAS